MPRASCTKTTLQKTSMHRYVSIRVFYKDTTLAIMPILGLLLTSDSKSNTLLSEVNQSPGSVLTGGNILLLDFFFVFMQLKAHNSNNEIIANFA